MGNPNIGEEGKKYRWKKGQSGNPRGKKRGTKSIKKTLQKIVDRKIDLANPLILNERGEPENQLAPLKDHLCTAMVLKALNGDVKAFETIVNRLEGMPEEKITGKLKVDNKLATEQLKESFQKMQAKEKGSNQE